MHPFKNFVFDKTSKAFFAHVKKAFSYDLQHLIQEDAPCCGMCEKQLYKEGTLLNRVGSKDKAISIQKEYATFLQRKAQDWQKVTYKDEQDFPFHYWTLAKCSNCDFHNHVMIREFWRHNSCEEVVFLTFLQGKDFKKTIHGQLEEIMIKRKVGKYNGYWFIGEHGEIFSNIAEFLCVYPKAKEVKFFYYDNDKLEKKVFNLERN